MKDLRDASERFEKRTGVSSVSVLNTKKRGSQSTAGMPSAKRSKTRSAIDAIVASGGETVSSIMTEPTDDSQTRRGVSRQCARYALEVLSSAGFRSHCFGLLVGVNEIQVLYYDRSIIAVSEPFPMVNLKEPDGLDCEDERRFVALLICLHRATLAQRGIMENLIPDPFLEVYQTYTDNMANDPKTLFVGKQIKLQVGGKAVLVKLGLIVMRQPGIIGRSTCVVEGTSMNGRAWTWSLSSVGLRPPEYLRTPLWTRSRKRRRRRKMRRGCWTIFRLSCTLKISRCNQIVLEADSGSIYRARMSSLSTTRRSTTNTEYVE